MSVSNAVCLLIVSAGLSPTLLARSNEPATFQGPSAALARALHEPSVALARTLHQPSVALARTLHEPSVALARTLDEPSVALAAAEGGAFAAGTPVQTGHVVICEFMKDPSAVSDARGEWIEVYNALPWRVNLEGWVLSDDSGASHVISTGGAGLRMGPGGYLLLGNNADPALNGGIQLDYAWSSFSLGNGADQIVLSRPDGTLVDRVAYDDGVLWPDLPGRSIALKNSARDAAQNDDPANWCHSSTAVSATNADTGTPRMDNDACP